MQGVEPESRFIETGDVRLHAADWGGPKSSPLLLLHGLSANARVWDDYARAARVQYQVVALDARGHGDSGWSPEAAYSTFDHVGDLARVFDFFGWEHTAIVGSSMGGRNALAFAAAYPERVTRLVLVDIGPGRRETDPPPPPPDPNAQREEAPMTFGSLDEGVEWMHRTYPTRSLELCRARVFHNTRRRADGRLEWKWDPNLYLSFRQWTDLWPMLGNVTCPVLLLRGAESTVLSAGVAHDTQRALPDCRLVEIPDVGHNIYTDRPDAFCAAVNPFLGLP